MRYTLGFLLVLLGSAAIAAPRVVSFSPAITDMAFDMGLGDRVVGVTNYCRLPDGESRPSIGDQFNITTEAILAVNPTVLLTQSDPSRFAALATVAPEVKIVHVKIESLEDIGRAMETVAGAAGDRRRGKAARKRFEKRLATLATNATETRPRVLFVSGTDRPSVAAAGSFIHDLIQQVGGENASDDIPGAPRWREATIESIIASTPDVLICHETREGYTEQVQAYWEQWEELAGCSIHVVTERGWTIPSPQLLDSGEQLQRLLAGRSAERGAIEGRRVTLLLLQIGRLAAVMLVGAALAAGGAALQGLLRNSLAEPYLLGISSGAGVGVLGGLALGSVLPAALPLLWVTPSLAFVGALIASAGVYSIARNRGVLDPHAIILAGVIVNALNAAIMLAMYLYIDPFRIPDFARWSMGQVPEMVDPWLLLVAGGLIVLGVVVLLVKGRALNVLSLGDAVADSSGVGVDSLRRWVFGSVALMTAASVALVGPIGFVGLIVPHIVRKIVGVEHRRLVLCSAIGGAVLLAGAEWVCRWGGMAMGIGKVPVGIVCALTGGPFFLYLLKTRSHHE